MKALQLLMFAFNLPDQVNIFVVQKRRTVGRHISIGSISVRVVTFHHKSHALVADC